MRSNAKSALTGDVDVVTINVAPDLKEPLGRLAGAVGQSAERIVNQALAEYLDRRLRPDQATGGSSSSYIELTAREELHDVF
jgi:hypothetical protein